MQDLFTYTSLGSLTGAVTATMLVVQFLKELGPTRRLPTRWLVLIAAEGIVAACNIATGEFAAANIPLYFLNGLLVAASAMASWYVIHDLPMVTSGRRFVINREKLRVRKVNYIVKEQQQITPHPNNLKLHSRQPENKSSISKH